MDTGRVAETSLSMAIYNTIRDHPTAFGITLLILIVLAVGTVLWIYRRLKREALGYIETGKKSLSGIRDRFEAEQAARSEELRSFRDHFRQRGQPRKPEVLPPEKEIDTRRKTKFRG